MYTNLERSKSSKGNRALGREPKTPFNRGFLFKTMDTKSAEKTKEKLCALSILCDKQLKDTRTNLWYNVFIGKLSPNYVQTITR